MSNDLRLVEASKVMGNNNEVRDLQFSIVFIGKTNSASERE